MPSPIRPRLAAAAALLLVVGGAGYGLTAAHAHDPTHDPTTPRDNLVLTSQDGAKPATMAQFLTSVTKDVDAYWAKTFAASGLPEPKVSYQWIPAGQTVASACGDEDGRLGDSAGSYCPGDDTIYISEKFATDIYDGALDQALPGSAQGYGGTVGDFASPTSSPTSSATRSRTSSARSTSTAAQNPTMAFELQADCYAGTSAKSAYDENRLEDGDVQEALDAALAVGDFDTDNPGHHGTPEQREQAWAPASTPATRRRARGTWTPPRHLDGSPSTAGPGASPGSAHGRRGEIGVRLRAQARDVLAVVGRGQRLVVADDVADLDAGAAAQPAGQAQGGRSCVGLPMRSESRAPTCSIPNAVQFSPTVWRQMIDSGTNCTIVPSRPTTKCEQTPGSSCSSTSGRSGATCCTSPRSSR